MILNNHLVTCIKATCFVPEKCPNIANRHILIIWPLTPVWVHLFIVVIVCTDKSFQLFEKNVFAFWMLIKEQLFRSALICDTSVKMSLS